jgi:hypothetical protein
MHFSILFTSFFAGVLALPIPQVGVSRKPGLITRTVTDPQQTGLGDVESGLAQGTNAVLSGGANNAVSSTGNSVAGLSSAAGNLINRSPEPQVAVSTQSTPGSHDLQANASMPGRPRRRPFRRCTRSQQRPLWWCQQCREPGRQLGFGSFELSRQPHQPLT